MEENIDDIIKKELDKLEISIKESGVADNIKELVAKQNDEVKKMQYKDFLIQQLEEIKKMDVDIEYSPSMSIKELEDILRSVKF